MPYFVLDQIAAGLNQQRKSINGSKVLVLGVAYKRDIDDLRESPSLTIIELLRDKGAIVAYNDPYFPTVGRGRQYDLNMTNTPLDNLAQYDAVVIVTDPHHVRLQGHCGAVPVSRRYEECHQGHRLRKDRSLLKFHSELHAG